MPHKDDNPDKGYLHDIEKQPFQFTKQGFPKKYKADKEYMKCPQSELTDEYGTPKEIANALFYCYDRLETDTFSNLLNLLLWVQRGLADDKIKHLAVEKPKQVKVATDQEIANKVHHTIDWLRACQKRTCDNRPMNPKKQMLEYCLKGLYINPSTLLHYDEKPERY